VELARRPGPDIARKSQTMVGSSSTVCGNVADTARFLARGEGQVAQNIANAFTVFPRRIAYVR